MFIYNLLAIEIETELDSHTHTGCISYFAVQSIGACDPIPIKQNLIDRMHWCVSWYKQTSVTHKCNQSYRYAVLSSHIQRCRRCFVAARPSRAIVIYTNNIMSRAPRLAINSPQEQANSFSLLSFMIIACSTSGSVTHAHTNTCK